MDMGAGGFALKLFGDPRLIGPDGSDRTPRLRKAFCLLAYLALQPNGQARRERLIGLLWGDRGQAQAQGSLRHALLELRQSLGDQADDLLIADRLSVRLDTQALAVDALGMDRLLAVGTAEAVLQASAGWVGDLLDGAASPGTAFDHWLEAERASRQAAILHALEKSVTEAEGSGRDRDIEALARALLRVDPAHERGHRALIDLHARKGAIAAALRQFEQCRKALAQSLDIEPSAELRSHVDTLRRRQSAPSGSAIRVMPHRTPVVAVFIQPAIGPPELVRDLSQLLEDELVTALSRYRTFSTRLIASPQQAAEAGPYLLRIGLRHDGAACRYGLRLCDTATNLQYLVEVLTFPLAADLVSVLPGLASFAHRVDYVVRTARVPQLGETAEAYDLWLAGDRMVETFSSEAFDAAIPLLNRAASADPGFARPLSGLASIELSWQQLVPGARCDPETLAHATRLARDAIAIDPWDSHGHIIAAWAYLRQRMPEQARRHFEQGRALNPDDPMTLIACAEGLAHLGSIDDAIRCGERALEIHPAPPAYFYWYLAVACTHAGAYERALTLTRLGPETVPELIAWRAVALASSGRAMEAVAAGEEFFQRLGRSWGGEEPFTRERALRWLDEVVLIPDESRRRQFVDAVSRITSSRGGSVLYRQPQRTMNPILLR
ncbi:BTAD domain-containing putative transcriptional regulator [Inquilinus sp. Marseille-Q2685]|uniref:BTAD domain-containing putative transcriptional regulator n=1 Tax=Inquilinus sp. Marseille-Q2685 TaxID=2866581 RepID=UPI001CE3FF2F|nr:BTAD domain-containing putative transcriptional regulator [Inquilinus sp. Marseille-Q2685]